MSINRAIKRSLGLAILGATFALTAPAVHAEENWYFYVENNSDSRIVALQVSENRKSWGDFDVGRGIAPGKTEKLIWDSSTDDEGCNQWIRAKFADGSASEPAKFNFCKNLDDPISFE